MATANRDDALDDGRHPGASGDHEHADAEQVAPSTGERDDEPGAHRPVPSAASARRPATVPAAIARTGPRCSGTGYRTAAATTATTAAWTAALVFDPGCDLAGQEQRDDELEVQRFGESGTDRGADADRGQPGDPQDGGATEVVAMTLRRVGAPLVAVDADGERRIHEQVGGDGLEPDRRAPASAAPSSPSRGRGGG